MRLAPILILLLFSLYVVYQGIEFIAATSSLAEPRSIYLADNVYKQDCCDRETVQDVDLKDGPGGASNITVVPLAAPKEEAGTEEKPPVPESGKGKPKEGPARQKSLQHAPKLTSAPHTVCKSYHEKNNISFEKLWTYPSSRILLGIFTTAAKFQQRQLIRTLYRSQQRRLKGDWVDFKFILGLPPPSKDSESLLLRLRVEQESFDDIVILNMTENMNKGKIYEYYKWAADTYGNDSAVRYDFISKTDDDAFVHFQNLGLNLRPLPREHLYYGFYVPHGTEWGYMTGMLEVLSSDFVSWIATSTIPLKHKKGPEDVVLGRWLAMGKFDTYNYVNENCLLTEDPRSRNRGWMKQKYISPNLVTIHGLKDIWKWDAIIDYYYGQAEFG